MRAPSGLRAAVNARLEEISFRTGLLTAAIALAALLAIAVAGVYAADLGHGRTPGGAPRQLSAASAPVTTPATHAAVTPRTPAHPLASPKPTARPPVTASAAAPQSAVVPPQAPASSSPAASGPAVPSARPGRRYGGGGPVGHGPGPGGGRGPVHGGGVFPGQGFPGPVFPGPARWVGHY